MTFKKATSNNLIHMFKGVTCLLKHLKVTLMWLHRCNLSSTLTPVNIHQYISYQQLDYQWKV